MPEYFISLIFFLTIAVLIHLRYRMKLYRSLGHMMATYAVVILLCGIWDHIAITRGYWSFDRQFLLGPHIGVSPIEEYGFIIVMPYFFLVIYKLLEKKFR